MCVEPSCVFGDAPCPACGTLLWFIGSESETLFYADDDKAFADHIARAVAHHLNIPLEELRQTPGWLKELHFDSVDLVEIMMEFEDREM